MPEKQLVALGPDHVPRMSLWSTGSDEVGVLWAGFESALTDEVHVENEVHAESESSFRYSKD
jgi:hypothetical protein